MVGLSKYMSREAAAIGAIVAIYALLVSIFWVGFIGSDDAIYLALARDWIAGVNELPDKHWGFRYTIILPLALALDVLGDYQNVENGTAVAFGVVLLSAVYVVIRKIVSREAAAIATGLLATTPIIVISTSVLNVDVLELGFGLCSVGLFTLAADNERPAKYLIFSGILLGLAFLTRETASALILAYGLFFLAGAFLDRKQYLWGALGFLLIFGAETLYYMSMGESPILRFVTAAQSHGTLGAFVEDRGSAIGNVSSSTIFGPILALLVNQEFGLLFFLVIPATWMLLREEHLPDLCRKFVHVLASVMVIWILWTSYNGALLPLPRYYIFATGLAVVTIGLWLHYMRNRRLAIAIGSLLVMTNIAAMSLENTHPRFPAKTLATFLETVQGPVSTDERTYKRVSPFLRRSSAEVRLRLLDTSPLEGGLYFFNPNMPIAERKPEDLAASAWKPENGELIQTWSPPKRLIGHVLTGLGLDGFLPESIRLRVVYCGGPPQLFRYNP